MPESVYVECEATDCDGGQQECHCDRSCCSGYERCEYCWGNMMVCSGCKFHNCRCDAT